ncbi:MAG: formylglycine-generating enzyme family protein [Methylococcus sp.]
MDELLRQQDMPRGPDDWQDVQDLLWRRFQQGRWPDPASPEKWASLLGPLLCRNPEEQLRFPSIVRQWLTGTESLTETGQISHLTHNPWPRWHQRLKRFDFKHRLGLLVLLLCAIGLWAALALQPPVVTPLPPPPLKETTLTQPTPVTVKKPPPVKIEDWAPPNTLPEPAPILPDAWKEGQDLLGLGLGLIPWLLFLPWAWLRYFKRPKILETDTPDGDETITALDFANPAQPLFGGSASEQALSQLGRVRYGESRRLDIPKTVEATARQGGYFTPCHRQSRQHPVYVVLVRSRHARDHQALLAEELVQRFRESGLESESYRFLDSPGQLIPWPLGQGGTLALPDLAQRHDYARLIIVSEGRILFHPATGQPRPWLDQLAAWPQRVWLGAGDVDDLDMRLLHDKGFLYLPLHTLSLAELAAYLSTASPWDEPGNPKPNITAELPLCIAEYPQRWLKPYPPIEAPVSELCLALREYLREDGWRVFKTLLAFPRCEWKLTLAVDYLRFEGKPEGRAENREARLSRLVKLPWLTHAFFPRYLRIALLKQASDAEREQIRRTWETLFQRRTGGQGGVKVFSPLREQIQDLIRADRAGALGDPVFVQILRGKRLDFWHFRLPLILDGLFPKGRGRWDLRPALAGLLIALAASGGGLWFWEKAGKDWIVGLWQDQIITENERWPVVIYYQATTQNLAQALKMRLSTQGFKVDLQPHGSNYTVDELGYPTEAKPQALRLAQTLRHVGYGLSPELKEIPGDTLRLELVHSYQARGTFNDTLAFGLDNPPSAKTGPFQDDLKDGGKGPVMVVIPAGSFTMGSPETEKGRYTDESPQHTVTIAQPFAMSRDEVTFDDYDRFAKATNRKPPDDSGWGRGNRPVIKVSWQDAQDYAAWLSKQTHQTYRLPSEAEWEYAARAGTSTAYWWGDELGKNHANGGGGGSEWDGKQTAPVGSFPANPWGLRDTAGNVWEWVEDCWHDNYEGAPGDGSAWTGDQGCDRGVRGGSWYVNPQNPRSAFRLRYRPDGTDIIRGFRLARAL